jgi:hypothetical protein
MIRLPAHPRNKYHNKPTVIDGIKFPSKKEGQWYVHYRLLQQHGFITNLKFQVRFPIVVNDVKICVYIADFTFLENGRDVVVDCKGMKTAVYRLKKKLLWATQRIDIQEV